MRRSAALLLVIALGCASREVPTNSLSEGDAPLQGKWEVVSSEEEGQPTTAVYRPGTKWVTVIVIEGDGLYFTDGFTKSNLAKFKLNAKVEPKAIDIGVDRGEEKSTKAIYALDGDSLRLCMSQTGERPKEFKTTAGDKTTLFVLKRQKL